MRTSLTKTVAGSLAAIVVALGLTAASAPASADPYWGYHHHRGYWGPALGLGIAGLAAGAIIASQQPYYRDSGYDDCTRWRPVYDSWGRYVGRRPVNVCY